MRLEEQILYPKKIKAILWLLVALTFTIGGFFMIADEKTSGWFVAIFFSLIAVITFINILPNAAYLKLDQDGFEFSSLYKKDSYNWKDVQYFSAKKTLFRTMIVFNFSENYQKYKTMRKISAGIGGVEGALPDTYGLKAKDLAYLMNEYKHNHSTI